jgi:hypothetical protein
VPDLTFGSALVWDSPEEYISHPVLIAPEETMHGRMRLTLFLGVAAFLAGASAALGQE